MVTFKIKLHSSVDLITNSSTVIFTYSGGSLKAVKELVNEMLKVFGKEETFDDIFYVEVFLEEISYYLESKDCPEEFNTEDWKADQIAFEQYQTSILKGEIKKPQWMKDIEEDEGYEGYSRSTDLHLLAKDEKYSELASKLLKYLYSTGHAGCYNG